jgi:hypothetical protein
MGSLAAIEVSFVDDDDNPISWELLQVMSCISGMNIAGIPIKRYQPGSSSCDVMVRQACSNLALLTSSDAMSVSCQCVVEEIRLKSQFAGVDLPSHCFTTVCDISNDAVYRTAEQLEGCTARLCTQTLAIHGTYIVSQGFQEILCNGEVYDLAELPTPLKVPFVSRIPISGATSLKMGPIFFVALGILGVMVLLVLVWGIRRWIQMRRSKKFRKQDEESILLQTLNPSKKA